MAKMTDAQLVAFVERQEARAARPQTADEQATAMNYYLGRPFGNEEEGMSSVVSSDVWDVVEGLTPLILKPFVSSDDVVRFQPQGPEDEDAAEQETDYINFVVTQKNEVFEQLVTWVKLGLLQKNGVVKYWWDKRRRVTIETFEGLSDDLYHAIISEDSVSVLEHTENEPTAELQEVTHDVKLRTVKVEGCAKFAAIPPEELRVSIDARSPDPKKSPFIQHITRKTLSDLREMGFDVADDINDASTGNPSSDPQATARLRNGEMGEMDGLGDPSIREVWFRESYAYVDSDGDGIAEARMICMVGSTVLADEEIDEWPFAGWTPYQQLFQFDGRCPADETLEIQAIKSTLWRQSLNNIYTINNNRTFVSDKVNLDDMVDNQIAGIVRIKGDVVGNHAMSMPVTPIGAIVQPMIEYLDSAKENRTGFTRYNQGTDANSLNKTATGVRLITEAAGERTGLIARAFAEQGLKPLMLGIHALCRRHATKAETIRLRGKWVEIDPRRWGSRYDMTVSVGLGNSDKTMQLQGHQMLMGEQKALAQIQGLVEPENFYNAAAKLSELLGEKDPGKYFSDPSKKDEGQQQLPPEVQQTLQQAAQEIEQLQQQNQQLQSGVMVEQARGANAQQLEQLKQAGAQQLQAQKDQAAQAFEAMKHQVAALIQEMKDDAALNREEMKTWKEIVLQKMQPPPQLAAEVAEDMADDGQA